MTEQRDHLQTWHPGEFGDGGRRTLKTSERLARELANHIVREDLPEGTRLPPEKEMLARFKVGRTTLREALRLLEARGVLRVRTGRQGGPVVRRPKFDDLGESLTLILEFERTRVSDVLRAREALLPMIARLAAARMTKAELEPIKQAWAEMAADGPHDHLEFTDAYRRCLSALAEASGNVSLRAFHETIESIALSAYEEVRPSQRRYAATAKALLRLVEALECNDPDAAERATRAHLDEVTAYWSKSHSAVYDSFVHWCQ